MKDDLISRNAILNEAKRLSGPITGDGWDNWGVYGLIERQPPVPAVPLDQLCETLAKNADCPPEHSPVQDHCIQTKCAECWKSVLKEWMEGQNA